MGADESKSAGSSGGGSFASASVEFPNMCRRHSESVAWTLLHQTTVDKWKDGHAEACNFAETTMSCDGGLHKDCSQSFCIARQGFVNISKASTIFSFRKRSKFYKMAEHFEYNHIPAQMSSVHNFRVMSVLCFRDSLVVLHLSRNGTDQLGLLDLKVNKFLGVFAKIASRTVNSTDRLFGALSPDKSKCLVRLPNTRNPRNTDMLHLYDLKSNTLLEEVNLHMLRSTHIAFDPRFQWQRAAITNFQGPQQNNSISIVQLENIQELHSNLRLCDTRRSLYPFMRDLQYSRDGSLIVATLVENQCFCREKRTRNYRPVPCSIYILHGDTVETLHCIQYQRFTCVIHACPTNYIPVFSDCGSRMAVLMNLQDQPTIHYIQIYKLPHKVQLQNMCRVAIRQNFTADTLTELPLPLRLINYLHFKPEF